MRASAARRHHLCSQGWTVLLRGAMAAAALGRTDEWIDAFLSSGVGANVPMAGGLKPEVEQFVYLITWPSYQTSMTLNCRCPTRILPRGCFRTLSMKEMRLPIRLGTDAA